jgi:[NiFe] hydrogenase diaphorase moiety large subunit
MNDLLSATLRKVPGCHHYDGTRLVQILRETQEAFGWLSPEAISGIAQAIGWPRAQDVFAQQPRFTPCRQRRL